MARIAPVVDPGVPRHVTQRGNRRERVFFEDEDFRLYRRPIAEAARRFTASAICFLNASRLKALIGEGKVKVVDERVVIEAPPSGAGASVSPQA
jgi:hypothetical protein